MIQSHLEVLSGWGMVNFSSARSYRPKDYAEVAEAITDARARELTVVHRGAGISYGDAALNAGGAVVHTSELNKILSFDPDKGVVRAQAGVTIAQLWKHVLGSGWWPPVVPGTMNVTLGGSAAMNIHGKNCKRSGSFGEHVLALTLLEANGNQQVLSRECDAERMRSIIGAQGLNGTILDLTLQLKRVYSGMLNVTAIPTATLAENLEKLEEIAIESEYAVGWIDAFATGRKLGRGLLHAADNLPPDHSGAVGSIDVSAQQLPGRIMGVVPSKHVWRMARPLVHRPGMKAVNFAKYLAGKFGGSKSFLQSHAAFHFLLDYVPNWKYVYRPGGLIQYQFFAPKEAAPSMFRDALRMQHKAGLPSYLAVLKRHRENNFAASYSVDGFSLALDFPVRSSSRDRLEALLSEFDSIQNMNGGKVYAAKDSVSRGQLPKHRDPLFSSDLVRRWEAPATK